MIMKYEIVMKPSYPYEWEEHDMYHVILFIA